jgi:hypothetical protein
MFATTRSNCIGVLACSSSEAAAQPAAAAGAQTSAMDEDMALALQLQDQEEEQFSFLQNSANRRSVGSRTFFTTISVFCCVQ